VEDDHVDRPDVDAQQCVQLTGTNHSNDLIALIINPSPAQPRMRLSRGEQHDLDPKDLDRKIWIPKDPAPATIAPQSRWRGPDNRRAIAGSCFKTVLRRPGDFCRATRPDPIPNSAVKRPSANGTMSQDLGE
jgi:hypothetical protein